MKMILGATLLSVAALLVEGASAETSYVPRSAYSDFYFEFYQSRSADVGCEGPTSCEGEPLTCQTDEYDKTKDDYVLRTFSVSFESNRFAIRDDQLHVELIDSDRDRKLDFVALLRVENEHIIKFSKNVSLMPPVLRAGFERVFNRDLKAVPECLAEYARYVAI